MHPASTRCRSVAAVEAGCSDRRQVLAVVPLDLGHKLDVADPQDGSDIAHCCQFPCRSHIGRYAALHRMALVQVPEELDTLFADIVAPEQNYRIVRLAYTDHLAQATNSEPRCSTLAGHLIPARENETLEVARLAKIEDWYAVAELSDGSLRIVLD